MCRFEAFVEDVIDLGHFVWEESCGWLVGCGVGSAGQGNMLESMLRRRSHF